MDVGLFFVKNTSYRKNIYATLTKLSLAIECPDFIVAIIISLEDLTKNTQIEFLKYCNSFCQPKICIP